MYTFRIIHTLYGGIILLTGLSDPSELLYVFVSSLILPRWSVSSMVMYHHPFPKNKLKQEVVMVFLVCQ